MDKSRRTYPNLPRHQGSDQIHKPRQLPDLSPDSASSAGGVANKDSISLKFGKRSSKQLPGTPIKKLLAEEMTPTTESRRRSPGVIARLMGLDGLPFQQPANKQHKDLQKTSQLEKARSGGTAYDGRSSRRSSRDQQEFKDVFEVSEIPKVESKRYSSADLKVNDDEMSFIEQKFMDAKRLANNQDLQSSKDFHDTLEVLDSNKDLLLKYLKRPDSLFKKHLDDLQAAPLQSQYGHVEPTNIENYERSFSWRSDRETTQVNYNRFHQNHHDGYPHQFVRRNVMHSSSKSSKHQFKGNHEQDAAPTKIVVLKPNIGKVQTSTRVVSSPHSSHNFLSEHGNHTEFPYVRFRDTEMHQTINLPDSARSFRHNSLESREIAKEVTRQMKNSLNNGRTGFSSRFRGYTGDDSSCSVSENESPEELEETATLENSLDLNNRSRRSSRSSESSVSREAKKRLSERWKIAHKPQEVQVNNRSSTLADMLANSDMKMKGPNFDSMTSGEGYHDKFSRNGEPARWVEPLGISSKDGWKDGYIGSLSRSKSLPSSSTAFGSPRTFLCAETLRNDRFLVPKETLKREKRRGTKSLDHRHCVNSRITKSGHKKSWSLLPLKPEDNKFSSDLDTIQNKIKINLEEDSPKLEVLATEPFSEPLKDTSPITDDAVDLENESAVGSDGPSSDKVPPELSPYILIKGDESIVDKNTSMQQDLSTESSGGSSVFPKPPVPELESPECKDSDQPSPVSVLEPLTDDLSSGSECFESLSADLQGLRMQLQLLKLESEEYEEGPMVLSSDEDGGEASNNGLCGTEESWESSYIIDVLSESGIDAAQLDASLEVWHSLECPVSPTVFEELEKRYSDWTTCSKSERRLLFDRINLGIVKLHEESTDAQPWVGPATLNNGSKLKISGLQDYLFKMLGNKGKVKDDALGKVLIMESQWLDLGDHIDVIGSEIERLILDDLVAEIVGY